MGILVNAAKHHRHRPFEICGGLSWVYHFGAVVYLSGFEKIQIGHADGFLSAVFPVLGHDFGDRV